MLGIDINTSTIRIVQLKRRAMVTSCLDTAELAIPAADRENPLKIAQLINEVVERKGWRRQKATLVLDRRLYIIKRMALGPEMGVGRTLSRHTIEQLLSDIQQTTSVAVDNLIFDVWLPHIEQSGELGGQHELLAAGADRKLVDFYATIAANLVIKVTGLELPSVAAINALLVNYPAPKEETFATAYVHNNKIDLAIVDKNGVASLQSLNYTPTGDEDVPGRIASELTRVVNTIKLSHPRLLPERMVLAGAHWALKKQLEQQRTTIADKLGITCEVIGALKGVSWAESLPGDFDAAPFIPALGAGYDGLEQSEISFNFLHPRGRSTEQKKHFSWRPLILIILGLMVLMAIYWFNEERIRKEKLQLRHNQISETQPTLDRMLQSRKDWLLFRSFVPQALEDGALDGGRRQTLRIIAEITSLFPDPNLAYVTDLSFNEPSSASSSATGSTVTDISIRGKMAQGDIVTEFINQLNASPMFQDARQAGSWATDTSDQLYPITFSITCNLKRNSGGTSR